MSGKYTNNVKPMTDSELVSVVHQFANNSLGLDEGTLQEERLLNERYYYGRPFGNERPGRSTVVLRQVFDTIEGIMPNLMKMFFSAEKVAEVLPVGDEDEELARQKTLYVNHVFMKQNDGFMILYNAFKEAMLKKNSVVKVSWVEEEPEIERYESLSEEAFQTIVNDPEQEVLASTRRESADIELDENISVEEYQQAAQLTGTPVDIEVYYDVTVRSRKKVKSIKIDVVPSEEVIISRRAKNTKENDFIGQRTKKTASDLLRMGIDYEIVKGLPAGTEDWYETEKIERYRDEEGSGLPYEYATWATRPVDVVEAYIDVDYDGDGFAERRKVLMAGNEVLENTLAKNVIFCSGTAIPMPHKFYGVSVAETVRDMQEIKSTLFRQLLDNVYSINNAKFKIVPGKVDLNDLLADRPSQYIRTTDPTAIEPIVTQPIVNQILPALDYTDTIVENRTGVSRYNQGMDANSLNKTASGINSIMSASLEKISLIGRIFAETLVKDIFEAILELAYRYDDSETQIRVTNGLMQVRPQDWDKHYDLNINVGLGTGDKDSTLQKLGLLAQFQEKVLAAQGGPEGPLMDITNVHNLLEKIVDASGVGDPGLFFNNPREYQPPPPEPEQPSPLEMDIQLKDERERMKLMSDNSFKDREIELKTREIEIKEKELALKELELEYEAQGIKIGIS